MTTQTAAMIVLAGVSYILGAIPSGYMIARRAMGIDIRERGSGNPGAANVYRTVGAKAGWATFLIDGMKGFVCVRLALHFFPDNYIFAIICGSIAIAGHMWTVFLKFRGGKGVATSAGVFAALLPGPTMIAFIVFAALVWYSGHISVGSIGAAAVLPAAAFFIGPQPLAVDIITAVIGAVVIYKHIPNMKRLWNKRELNFEDGAKKRKHENK